MAVRGPWGGWGIEARRSRPRPGPVRSGRSAPAGPGLGLGRAGRGSPRPGGFSPPPPGWARGRPGPVSGIVRGGGRSSRDVNKGVRLGDLRLFSLDRRRLRAELRARYIA